MFSARCSHRLIAQLAHTRTRQIEGVKIYAFLMFFWLFNFFSLFLYRVILYIYTLMSIKNYWIAHRGVKQFIAIRSRRNCDISLYKIYELIYHWCMSWNNIVELLLDILKDAATAASSLLDMIVCLSFFFASVRSLCRCFFFLPILFDFI